MIPPNKACNTARDGKKYMAAYVESLPWPSQNWCEIMGRNKNRSPTESA